MAVVEMECVREIPDNVQEKLAQYEELFKDRYTKKDQGYRSACQMDETLFQVPVLSPWPPFPLSRRGKRGYHDGGHRGTYERRHGHNKRPRDRHYHHSDDRDVYGKDYPPRHPGGRRGEGYHDLGTGREFGGHEDPSSIPPPCYHHVSPHRRLSPWRPSSRFSPPPESFDPRPPFPLGRGGGRDLGNDGYRSSPSGAESVEAGKVFFGRRDSVEKIDVLAKTGGDNKKMKFDFDEMVGLNKKEEVPSQSDVSDILAIAHGPSCEITLGGSSKGRTSEASQLQRPKPSKEKDHRKLKRQEFISDADNSSLFSRHGKLSGDHRGQQLAPPVSAASILAGKEMTKQGGNSSKKALLLPSLPSDREGSQFGDAFLDSLIQKKSKKKSKKKKKSSSKERELDESTNPKKKKKRPRSDSVPLSENEEQVVLGIAHRDEEVEDVDVTTPIRDVAPLSVALRKNLEIESGTGEPTWDQQGRSGGRGVWMPGEGITQPKKKHKSDGLAEELLVQYSLKSVPKYSQNISAPAVVSDNSERLSSADSPSLVHQCHSKYEGNSIKMVFQRNEATIEKKKDKKKKDRKKRKHKRKKDKRQSSKEPDFQTTPDHSTLSVPKASTEDLSLKVTFNRSKLSVTP